MPEEQYDYYLSKLRKILIFRYLNDEALRDILKIANIVKYKTDDRIISEGEMSPYFYAVLEGNVNVSVQKGESKEVFLSLIGEGEVFGEAGIFLKVRRTANVISSDNSTILRVHRKDLLDFIRKQPSSGIKILMIVIYSLLKKLRESNQELAFERKSNLSQDDIDGIVDDLMKQN
jgi:CRP/FNR family cyclic AMP-dependent transcriptional regulator